MNHQRLIRSAHDCSEGGIVSTLAECCLGSGEELLGVRAELDDDLRPVIALFGESQGRVVLSCDPDSTEALMKVAERHGVPARRIGVVTDGGDGFEVTVRDGSVSASISDVSEAYFGSIPSIMDASPTSGA